MITGNVTMFGMRPKCRICGSRSHVLTVGNRRSPRVGACAWCGSTLAELVEWAEKHDAAAMQRLIASVAQFTAAQQPATTTQHHAV